MLYKDNVLVLVAMLISKLKVYQNKCVFSLFLKMSRVGESLMNFGNGFYNVGVEYQKDHAAKV